MATNTAPLVRTRDPLWLWWGVAGLVGFIGGMAIKTAIEVLASTGGFASALEAIPPLVFGMLLGAMLGIAGGLAQWFVLRRRMPGVGAWVAATLAASTLFWALHNSGLLPFAHTPWGTLIQGFGHGALLGATFGAAQYLVLRGRVAYAARWVAISAASYSLAGALMHLLLDILFASADIHGPFDILIVSVVAALLSGYGLQHLLSQHETGA